MLQDLVDHAKGKCWRKIVFLEESLLASPHKKNSRSNWIKSWKKLSEKMSKGGKDYIVYRQPGAGSGVSVCKKTSTVIGNNQNQNLHHHQHPPKQQPTSLLIDNKSVAMFEQHMNQFSIEECIFGSTSPRCLGGTAMTNSDYIRTIGSGSGGHNESDNNISSCSTLDIGYKVSSEISIIVLF